MALAGAWLQLWTRARLTSMGDWNIELHCATGTTAPALLVLWLPTSSGGGTAQESHSPASRQAKTGIILRSYKEG